MVKIMLASMVASQRMAPMGMMKVTQEDLVVLQGLLEAGEVTPVISRRYTLSDVPDALRHQGEGHAAGKSVIFFPVDRSLVGHNMTRSSCHFFNF